MVRVEALLTGEKGPDESRAVQSGGFGDDRAMTDSAAGLVQRGTKNGQEADRRNHTLEREEVLNLSGVSWVQ